MLVANQVDAEAANGLAPIWGAATQLLLLAGGAALLDLEGQVLLPRSDRASFAIRRWLSMSLLLLGHLDEAPSEELTV